LGQRPKPVTLCTPMDHAAIAQLMLFLAIVMLLLLAIVEGWK
jgi:hypothetical protein